MLCSAAIQVFGRMNKTIEGVPMDEGAPYVNKYFLLPTDTKSTDTVTLSLDEGELEEGYYHMSAKVRVQAAALRLSRTYTRRALCGGFAPGRAPMSSQEPESGCVAW